MKKPYRKMAAAGMAVLLTVQLSGCGLLLHPERKGQTGGRIDPGIAVLDAVGLLFYIVPGLIAFGIDFTYGTIYLPGGSTADANGGDGDMRVVDTGIHDMTLAQAQAIVSGEIGQPVDLNAGNVKAVHLGSVDELAARLAQQR